MRQFIKTLYGDPLRIVRIVCVVGAFFLAIFLRTAFNYDHVFADDGVELAESDALFHMRTIHNLVHNFPWRSQFDPYGAFPDGLPMPTAPLFDYVVAIASLVIGFGNPSPDLIDTVGAWTPCVLSALVVFPVYFLSRLVFDPVAACFAALMVSVLPGTFAIISRLGFADHHSLEVLLAITSVWLLTEALSRAGKSRRLVWSCAAGVALAGYLCTRAGGAFVVAVLVGWALAQVSVDAFHGRSEWRVLGLIAPAFAIAVVLAGPAQPLAWGYTTALALCGGAAALAVWSSVVFVLRKAHAPPWAHALAFTTATLVGLGALALFLPDTLMSWSTRFLPVLGDGPARSVRELQPTLVLGPGFSATRLFEEFGTTIVFAAPLIPVLWRRAWSDASFGLYWCWSAVMLALGLSQMRMVPYAVVALAPLAGQFASRALEVKAPMTRMVVFGLLAALVWAPNIKPAVGVYELRAVFPPHWKRTFTWLRTQTPEPLGDPRAYRRWYAQPEAGRQFDYPPSAYGVLAWWDFGYAITVLGQRIPTTTGTQTNVSGVSKFYSETDPLAARELLEELGVRYVIVDRGLPLERYENWVGRDAWFYAITQWAARDAKQFFELYFERASNGQRTPVVVYYPDYYRTMMARLFLFNAEPAEPDNSTWAIRYNELIAGSRIVRDIVEKKQFETLGEAEEFLAEQTEDNWVIAGLHPYKTCAPINGIGGYELRFKATRVGLGDVKVFEVVDDGQSVVPQSLP